MTGKTETNELKVALAQISPVWLNKEATKSRILSAIKEASKQESDLIVFGEGFWPGYPFWLAYTEGAAWDLPINKAIHAHYLEQGICIEEGDLEEVQACCKKHQLAAYLGIMERPLQRGGHSLYCSLVYIDQHGQLGSVHRKLQPTYDERLTWSPGDGHGLQVHALKGFRLGGLNCWENWMPLPRASLYAQGENVHIAVWPGGLHNTKDITRFIARESRSYALSVSALLRKEEIPQHIPYREEFIAKMPEWLANGGSAIAGPDGEWELEPVIKQEGLLYHSLNLNRIYQERMNFDPVGHYSRPDVTRLYVNRERQSTLMENNLPLPPNFD